MDLQYLRTVTRPEHEATEAAMPLLRPGLTRERYLAVLGCLYPPLRSWESWAAEHGPQRLQPLLLPRRRSPLLEADLRFLCGGCGRAIGDQAIGGQAPGGQAPRWAPCWAPCWAGAVLEPRETLTACPPGAFEAGFLGCLYVLEGSTLGGRFLARQVETALHLLPGQGSAYFGGHGEATGSLWREVQGEIAAVPDAYAERLVRAAKRTFAIFRGALEGGEAGTVTGDFHAQ